MWYIVHLPTSRLAVLLRVVLSLDAGYQHLLSVLGRLLLVGM